MQKFVVTIDTNCINTRQADQSLNALEEWHQKGFIEIVKTDVMDTELLRAHNNEFRVKSSRYNEDVGVAYWNISRWGAHWADPNDHSIEEIRRIMFPRFDSLTANTRSRAQRDAMQLGTHLRYKRDFFVTKDKHFITSREKLNERFGIIILTPEECVAKLSRMDTVTK